MSDDEKLRFLAEFFEERQEAMEVDIVERGFDLVENVERRRACPKDGEQESHRGERPFAAGKQRQSSNVLTGDLDEDLDTCVEWIIGFGQRQSPFPTGEQLGEQVAEVAGHVFKGVAELLSDFGIDRPDDAVQLPTSLLDIVELSFEKLRTLAQFRELFDRQRIDNAERTQLAFEFASILIERRTRRKLRTWNVSEGLRVETVFAKHRFEQRVETGFQGRSTLDPLAFASGQIPQGLDQPAALPSKLRELTGDFTSACEYILELGSEPSCDSSDADFDRSQTDRNPLIGDDLIVEMLATDLGLGTFARVPLKSAIEFGHTGLQLAPLGIELRFAQLESPRTLRAPVGMFVACRAKVSALSRLSVSIPDLGCELFTLGHQRCAVGRQRTFTVIQFGNASAGLLKDPRMSGLSIVESCKRPLGLIEISLGTATFILGLLMSVAHFVAFDRAIFAAAESSSARL